MLQPSTTIYNLLSGRASRLSGPSVLWGVCSYQVWCPRKVELCKISLQSQRSSEWISMTSGHDVDLKIYKTLKHLETTKHKKKVTPDITRLSTASERCKSMEPAKREGHEGPWNALKPSNHIKSYQIISRSIKIYQAVYFVSRVLRLSTVYRGSMLWSQSVSHQSKFALHVLYLFSCFSPLECGLRLRLL